MIDDDWGQLEIAEIHWITGKSIWADLVVHFFPERSQVEPLCDRPSAWEHWVFASSFVVGVLRLTAPPPTSKPQTIWWSWESMANFLTLLTDDGFFYALLLRHHFFPTTSYKPCFNASWNLHRPLAAGRLVAAEAIKALFQEIAVVFVPQNYASTHEDLQLRANQAAARLSSKSLQPLAETWWYSEVLVIFV